MNCSTAADMMMEADPQELSGEGDSDLASHLEGCSSCRAMAEQLIDGHLSLAMGLDARMPRLSVEDALHAAERRASALRRRNARLQIGAPLAAAAGFVALVLLEHGSQAVEEPVQTTVVKSMPGLDVTGPPGKDIAVFKVLDRPDIVVVWFFDAGDE
jgi:hypothetical protein